MVSWSTCVFAALLGLTQAKGDGRGAENVDTSSWDKLSEEFDSLMSTLNYGAKTILEYIGDENGCQFKCKNGATPIQNPRHKKSSNGCGSMGIQIDTRLMPGVTKCCHSHDYCYDTCNVEKEFCDTEFKGCLEDICDDTEHLFSPEIHKGCKNVAALMYSATMALGCKSYREAQAQACLCHHPGLPGPQDPPYKRSRGSGDL